MAKDCTAGAAPQRFRDIDRRAADDAIVVTPSPPADAMSEDRLIAIETKLDEHTHKLDEHTRELVDVTGVRRERGGAAAVTYTWQWKPTSMAGVIGYAPAEPQEATARLRRSAEGWVVEDAGVK